MNPVIEPRFICPNCNGTLTVEYGLCWACGKCHICCTCQWPHIITTNRVLDDTGVAHQSRFFEKEAANSNEDAK